MRSENGPTPASVPTPTIAWEAGEERRFRKRLKRLEKKLRRLAGVYDSSALRDASALVRRVRKAPEQHVYDTTLPPRTATTSGAAAPVGRS